MKLKQNSFIAYHIISKIQKNKLIPFKQNNNRFFRSWSRTSTIYPFMNGYTIAVHNGKKHIPIFIESKMIGFKLGDFALTRNFKGHSKKKKGKKVKK